MKNRIALLVLLPFLVLVSCKEENSHPEIELKNDGYTEGNSKNSRQGLLPGKKWL